MAGQCASHSEFEELGYDFFVQALKVYGESISDSRAQFQAIVCLIGTLRQTKGLSQDNYGTLITKTALYGSKLLKKPDQCRAVYLASHLWWNKDIMDDQQHEQESPTINTNDSNNSKRVLECLQKALKIADSCMDMVTSVELFVEILNQCIYYYDKGNSAVSTIYRIKMSKSIKCPPNSVSLFF